MTYVQKSLSVCFFRAKKHVRLLEHIAYHCDCKVVLDLWFSLTWTIDISVPMFAFSFKPQKETLSSCYKTFFAMIPALLINLYLINYSMIVAVLT